VDTCAVIGGVFTASFLRTDFKSALYWREQGYPAAGVRDGFGSAILRGSDGHVLLGRQSAGHLNAGLAYLPSGFIDPADVDQDGVIDIAGSIARELAEETGLDLAELGVLPGFWIVRCGPLVTMAREYRSPLPAAEVRKVIMDHLAADPDPELADIVIIASPTDLEAAGAPPYTRLAVGHVMGFGGA
jgi:8-oxo-dGTP pyrophosphatase MutT (NUDIX family)